MVKQLIYKTRYDNGGFGDRLVGLISTMIMSKHLSREFKIYWESPSIEEYFDYEKYKYKPDRSSKREEYIVDEKLENYKTMFSTKNINEIWPEDHVIIQTNQNIHQYLYINPNYKNTAINYLEDTVNAYRNLFNILKIKEYILNDIRSLTEKISGKRTIGVQLRLGDCYMVGNSTKFAGEEKFNSIMNLIDSISVDSQLFITSDCELFIKLYNKRRNFLYNNKKVIHFDMTKENIPIGIIKLIQDIILLSKCDIVYVSPHTNFGYICSLMNNKSPSMVIYPNNPSVSEVPRKTLTSKGKLVV